MGEGDRTSFVVYTEDGVQVGLTSKTIILTDCEVEYEGENKKTTSRLRKRWFLDKIVRELKGAKETGCLVLVGSKDEGCPVMEVAPEMKEVIDNLLSFTEQLLEIENEKANR